MAYKRPTFEDVWAALDRPSSGPSGDSNLTRWLGRAERKLMLLLAARGASWDVLSQTQGEYLADLIVDAVARIERSEAVKAGLKNEAEGGYSYSVGSARDASAHLWWPDDDLALLGGTVAGTLRVGSIKMNLPQRSW